jgi:hypothetical protein
VRTSARIIGLYAILALLTIPVFPHFLSPNEFSRWIVDAALFDDHSLDVSHINSLFGNRIDDLAKAGGRTLSNKAPGESLIGLPAFALARLLTGPAGPNNVRITLTAMRWLASTVPLIALALLMLSAATRLGADDASLRWMTAVVLFATPLFAYGMLLFSHALAGFALFGAWMFLFIEDRPVIAGVLMGLAVLTEYTSAAVAILFLICALTSRPRLARFVLGGVPFLAALLLYNYAAFGNPFYLSYTFTELGDYRALAQSGLFGIHAPSLGTLALQLFDPSRGLFVLSPVLVCAFSSGARQRLAPAAFWSLVGAPIVLILLFSGYPYWHGGWGIGARYLMPALPFVIFLIAFGELSFGAAVLTGMSIAAVTLTSLVFPFVPPNAFPLPWGSLAWPILADGLVAPNLLHFIARPLAIVVPFAIVVAAALIATPRRYWIGVAAGAIATVAVGILYARSTDNMLMARAYIEEVYFDQRGALVRHLPPGVGIQPRVEQHMRSELEAPPPTWNF